MKAIEQAKIALRKHLLDNKEQVKADLEKMREISKGIDIFSYIENISNAFAIENAEIVNQEILEYSFEEIELYGLIEGLDSCYEWYPPDILLKDNNKKDSDILSESFFLHLNYGGSSKSSIFI